MSEYIIVEDILVKKIYPKNVIFHFPVRFLSLELSFYYIIYIIR